MAWTTYTWMLVVHGLVAWLDAYGIGANDMANAFGSAVGSKTLKLWTAVVIASVFEFLGAVLLGGNVTQTIAGSIARTSTFATFPAFFMYGMLCAEIGSVLWILVATYLELPVSTTHAIIGGIMGFTLVFAGPSAVVWYAPDPRFPYMTGFLPVVVSWFLSPLAAALICCSAFLLLRTAVLRRRSSTQIAYVALPLFIFSSVLLGVFFVMTQSPYFTKRQSINYAHAGYVGMAVAAGVAIFGTLALLPCIRRSMHVAHAVAESHSHLELSNPRASTGGVTIVVATAADQYTLQQSLPQPPAAVAAAPQQREQVPQAQSQRSPSRSSVSLHGSTHSGLLDFGCVRTRVDVSGEMGVDTFQETVERQLKVWAQKPGYSSRTSSLNGCSSRQLGAWRGDADGMAHTRQFDQGPGGLKRVLLWSRSLLLRGLVEEVTEGLERESAAVVHMHEGAERFDPRTEQVFKYLQVLSSCAVSFAHGANDVANAIGSFSAAYYVYMNLQVPGEATPVYPWIMVLGASGIVVGLATYGFNIMKVMALRCTHITPSRGFCMEASTAFVVAAGAVCGLPLSTTHTIVGAAIGCGLAEGRWGALNVRIFFRFFVGWVVTAFVSAGVSALLFALGTHIPSQPDGNALMQYQQYLLSSSAEALQQLNQTLAASAAAAGNMSSWVTPAEVSSLSDRVASLSACVSSGCQAPEVVVSVHQAAMQLLEHSNSTL